MSEPVSWQCRDCDQLGDSAGTAVAHLQDSDVDPAHTVDFIDADGLTVASSTRDGDGNIASVDADPAQLEQDESEAEQAVAELTLAEQAYLTYIGEVIAEHGADFQIVPCPHCRSKGWRELDLRMAPDTEECVDCGGHGRVMLPSFVPNQREDMCKACQGNGWRKVAPVAQLPQAGAQAPAGGLPQAPPGYAWSTDGQLIKLTG